MFREAVAFNQDVSKWNTGAVTSMSGSKCTHVLSLLLSVATPSVVEYLNVYDNSSIIRSHFSHVLLIYFFSKCFATAVSNEHCVAASGNRCLQTVI